MLKILNELEQLSDKKHIDFQAKLIPNINKEEFLGVRIPLLRTLSKNLLKYSDFHSTYERFSKELPHKYYDENNLHVLFINEIKDYSTCIHELSNLLPFINIWASCDLFKPKAFKKEPEKAFEYISKCVQSKHTYTCRFGIVILIYFFTKSNFNPEHLKLIYSFTSEEYYINMANAWYLASALTFHFDESIFVLSEYKLDKWTHNKSIQKCLESLAINDYKKDYLRTLKI